MPKPYKHTPTFVGILILVAYSMLANLFTGNKIVVLLADVVSGLAVIGIPTLLFSYFQKVNKNLTLAYFLLKLCEGLLMILGGFLFLTEGTQIWREWIYNNIHLHVFTISGFLFYYLFYKSKLIPRFISIWGGMAIFTLLLRIVLGFFGLQYAVIDAMLILIVANEFFLAGWLIKKGFVKK